MAARGRSGTSAQAEEAERKSKRTFTLWINSKVKHKELRVGEITEDLADGVILCVLLSELARTEISYRESCRNKFDKLGNLGTALEFVKGPCEIQITGLGGEDIHDGNLKLILGLIWQLILKFELSTEEAKGEKAIKAAMMGWVRKQLKTNMPSASVDTFAGSFDDGTAFLGIIDSLCPGAVNLDDVDPNNARENLELAFTLAEENLGVSRLLDVDDMLSGGDERSVLTYISQIYNAHKRLEEERAKDIDAIREAQAAELARMEAERAAAQADADALAQEKEDALAEAAAKHAEDVAAREAAMDEMSKRLADLEEEVRRKDAALGDLESTKGQQLKSVADELERVRRETAERLAAKETEAERALREAEEAREAAEEERSRLEREARKGKTQAEVRMADLERERDDLQRRLSEVEAQGEQVSAAKRRMETELRRARTDSQSNSGQLDALRAQIEHLREELSAAREEQDRLERAKGKAERSAKKARDELAGVNDELHGVRRELSDKDAEAAAARVERDSLRDMLEDAKESRDRVKADADRDIANLRRQLDEALASQGTGTSEATLRELAELRALNDETTQQLDLTKANNKRLSKRFNDAEMRADEAEVARVSLDKQVRRLNDELKRAQSRGLDADSDQGALLAQIRDLERRIRELERESEDLASERDTAKAAARRAADQLSEVNEELADEVAGRERAEGQVRRLRKTVEGLELQVEEHDAVVADLHARHQTELRQLVAQLEAELQAKLSEAEAFVSAMNNELNMARKELEDEQTQSQRLSAEARRSTKRISDLESRLRDEDDARLGWQRREKEYEYEIKILRKKIADHGSPADLSEQIRMLEEEVARLRTINEEEAEKGRASERAKRRAETAASELRTTVEGLEADVAARNRDRNRLAAKVSELSEELETTADNLEATEKRERDATKALERAQQQLLADQSALERLTTKRVQLEGDIAELTSEVEEWQRKASKVSNRLKGNEDMASQLDAALRDKMAAERALDKARSEITLLTEAVSGAERRAMAAEADLTTTRHELSTNHAREEERAVEFSRLNRRVTELETGAANAATDLAEMEASVADLQTDNRALVQKNTALTTSLSELKRDMNMKSQMWTDTQSSLERQVASLTGQVSSKDSEMRTMRLEMARLEDAASDFDRELQRLERAKTRAAARYADLQDQLEDEVRRRTAAEKDVRRLEREASR